MTDRTSTQNNKQIYVIMGWMAPFGSPLSFLGRKFHAFCSTPANRLAVARDLAIEKKWFMEGLLSVEMVEAIARAMRSVPQCQDVLVASLPEERELTPFGAYRYFPLADLEQEADATVERICAENSVEVRVFINAGMVRQMQMTIDEVRKTRQAA